MKAAGKAGLLEELSRVVSGLREKLLSLMEELKEYDDFLIDIYADLALIAEAGRLRMSRCKYYRDGYCHRWYWTERPPELDYDEIKRDYLNGRVVYRVRVEKRPVLCAVCPYFEETTGYGDVRIRWKPLKHSTR